jgi:hypothetical protein
LQADEQQFDDIRKDDIEISQHSLIGEGTADDHSQKQNGIQDQDLPYELVFGILFQIRLVKRSGIDIFTLLVQLVVIQISVFLLGYHLMSFLVS